MLEAGKDVIFNPEDDGFEHQLDLRMVSSLLHGLSFYKLSQVLFISTLIFKEAEVLQALVLHIYYKFSDVPQMTLEQN